MTAVPVPDFGNYLATANPYGLARPPVFFLRALHTQDPELVLFPSAEEPTYRLCRRVKHGPPPAMQMALRPSKHPDMRVMVRNRLIGVTGILPRPSWGPALLADLARMDLWRMGGADKACDALERLEEEKRQQADAAMSDEAGQRAISAWEALKLRQGSTAYVHSS
jgi:hypothetical protein